MFVALTRNVTRFGVSSVETIRENAAYPLIDPRQPPTRKIRRGRPAMSKGYSRETHNV
jgi:hypothetical protein